MQWYEMNVIQGSSRHDLKLSTIRRVKDMITEPAHSLNTRSTRAVTTDNTQQHGCFDIIPLHGRQGHAPVVER